jgi:hypothetical protein
MSSKLDRCNEVVKRNEGIRDLSLNYRSEDSGDVAERKFILQEGVRA